MLLIVTYSNSRLPQLGSFGFVYEYGFPAWFALIALIFLYLETRKQYRRYFKKGSATVLGERSSVILVHAPGGVNHRDAIPTWGWVCRADTHTRGTPGVLDLPFVGRCTVRMPA